MISPVVPNDLGHQGLTRRTHASSRALEPGLRAWPSSRAPRAGPLEPDPWPLAPGPWSLGRRQCLPLPQHDHNAQDGTEHKDERRVPLDDGCDLDEGRDP